MKFGPVPLDEANGAILAHSQKVGDATIRKGSLLDEAAIAKMRGAGWTEVICAQLEPGDVPFEIRGQRRDIEAVGVENVDRVVPLRGHARPLRSQSSSRSSSSAPGSRSKKASRLRSRARRSWGIVPSIVWRVRPAVVPSFSESRASSTA